MGEGETKGPIKEHIAKSGEPEMRHCLKAAVGSKKRRTVMLGERERWKRGT